MNGLMPMPMSDAAAQVAIERAHATGELLSPPLEARHLTFDLITSCASSLTESPRIRCSDLPKHLTMEQALNEWLKLIDAHREPRITARELYRGMGFQTLMKTIEAFRPQRVVIVSGAMGFVDIDDWVVPYDFSATTNMPENILLSVTAEPFVTTVWWRMLNAARRSPPTTSPVREMVEGTTSDYVVIACSKAGLKYIAEDILSIPYKLRDKVRILLAASNQGSVPAQLRPMMLPFERSFISHLPGNRSDGNHRAAYQYLEMMTHNPEFARQTVSQQRGVFINVPRLVGDMHSHDEHVPYGRTKVDLEAFLRERPQYLGLPWEQAFILSRRELGVIGGRLHFRGLLRKLREELVVAPVVGEDATLQDSGAVEALAGLGLTTTAAFDGSSGSVDDEEEVLRLCRVFVSAVRSANPRAVFQAADVCKWAGVYWKSRYPHEVTGFGPDSIWPTTFDSPKKLAHLLKANKGLLGLVEIGSGSSKAYCLA
jgi:hypothetical protein